MISATFYLIKENQTIRIISIVRNTRNMESIDANSIVHKKQITPDLSLQFSMNSSHACLVPADHVNSRLMSAQSLFHKIPFFRGTGVSHEYVR